MSFFISNAYAEAGAAAAPPPGGGIQSLIMIGLFAVIFYFMIWRPQAKRQKEHKAMVEGLSKGDEIVTTGGVMGKITKVGDDVIHVEVAEGVELKVQRHALASVLPKGTIKSA
jgi:preprotein translocase subunit YajC|tara:strand:- start:51 stop:389 length:339 start_codon:yes stop_codon:yes gene_type:complete